MTLIPRPHPCLCCSCPECGAVFMASALNEEYNDDSDANKYLLNQIAGYAGKGFNVSVKDVSEYKMYYCEHVKALKDK